MNTELKNSTEPTNVRAQHISLQENRIGKTLYRLKTQEKTTVEAYIAEDHYDGPTWCATMDIEKNAWLRWPYGVLPEVAEDFD